MADLLLIIEIIGAMLAWLLALIVMVTLGDFLVTRYQRRIEPKQAEPEPLPSTETALPLVLRVARERECQKCQHEESWHQPGCSKMIRTLEHTFCRCPQFVVPDQITSAG